MKPIKQSEGFALIEVLLAIVILAIGLLAGSRMQILGLNFTQGAMTQSYATMAASDILDRMRLNVDAIDTYNGFSTENGAPGEQNCEATGCDPIARANEDLRLWSNYFDPDVATLLPPDAIGSISVDGAISTVTIRWKDFISGEESDEQTISIGAAL